MCNTSEECAQKDLGRKASFALTPQHDWSRVIDFGTYVRRVLRHWRNRQAFSTPRLPRRRFVSLLVSAITLDSSSVMALMALGEGQQWLGLGGQRARLELLLPSHTAIGTYHK